MLASLLVSSNSALKPMSPTSVIGSHHRPFPVHIVLNGYCDLYSDVDLNLYVYNRKGHLVAKSENPVCYEEVTFTPEKQSRFEIVVKSENSVAKMDYEITIGAEAEACEPNEQ